MTSASSTLPFDGARARRDEGAATSAAPAAAAPRPARAHELRSTRRPWFARHGRLLGVGALLLVVLFPFLWLVQLAFRPAADIFDESLLFKPTLDGFVSLLQ